MFDSKHKERLELRRMLYEIAQGFVNQGFTAGTAFGQAIVAFKVLTGCEWEEWRDANFPDP